MIQRKTGNVENGQDDNRTNKSDAVDMVAVVL